MRPRQDPSESLLGLARAQNGMLHSSQVDGLGLGRHPVARLTASGGWQRIERGLFFLGPDQPDWRGWAWGGILLGGPDSRLAGQAAAHLHGFADAPERLEVLVPHARVMTDRPPWEFRRERAGVREAARRGRRRGPRSRTPSSTWSTPPVRRRRWPG